MHGQDSCKHIIFLPQVVGLRKHSSTDTFIKRTGVWWKLLRWANSEVKTTSLGGQCQQDSNDILAFNVYKRCFELASHVRGSGAPYRKSRLEGGNLDQMGFGRNWKYFWREILCRTWFLIFFFFFFPEENNHSQGCVWTWQTLKCERDSKENHSLSENSIRETLWYQKDTVLITETRICPCYGIV